jgi:hypothetical protein
MFWPNTLPSCISVNTFGFFILYTSIPHSKIKDRDTERKRKKKPKQHNTEN